MHFYYFVVPIPGIAVGIVLTRDRKQPALNPWPRWPGITFYFACLFVHVIVVSIRGLFAWLFERARLDPV
jgi:hypothetical protein